MIAHSQPIALPAPPTAGLASAAGPADYTMHDVGSYPSSSDGAFNPASFTRHFLGSPISWRAAPWGISPARFPAGSPTAQLLSSIDLNDYRAGKTPSSIESDSIMNALNVFEREGELCRNYTCCGLRLTDLHALLEHFEEVHILVLDPESAQPQAHIQIPFNPTVHPFPQTTTYASTSQPQNQFSSPHHLQSQSSHPHPLHQQHQAQPYATPFDPDDMELDIDLDAPPPPPPPSARSSARSSPSSCAPSPPDTPISTPLSAWPSPRSAFVLPGNSSSSAQQHQYHLHAQYLSQPPSPLGSAYAPSSTAASTRHTSPALSGSASPPASSANSNPNSANGNQASSQQQQQRPSLNLNLALAPGTAFAPARASTAPLANAGCAFNAYARFASDYSACMPGAQFNGATVDEASAISGNQGAGSANSSNASGAIHSASANGVSGSDGSMGGMWGHNSNSQHMWGQGPAMGGLGIGLGGGMEDGGGCVPPALLFASGSPKSEDVVVPAGKGSKGQGQSNRGGKANAQGGGSGRKAQTAPTTPASGVGNPFNHPGAIASARSTGGGGGGGVQAGQHVQQHAQGHLQSALHASLQHAQQQNASHLLNAPDANQIASTSSSSSSSTPASLARAAASPLLMSKPFRCPKPNCNKSYKQANGLKYHMTHGSCNFAPPKDLEHVKDLLERKRREREREGGGTSAQGQVQGSAGLMRSVSTGSGLPGAYGVGNVHATGSSTVPTTPISDNTNPNNNNNNNNNPPPTPLSPTSILSLTPADLSNISESDLVEVEREAERRLRPFACGVGECSRRYKNMNGLRYHYQHSGDHGAVGLALLASGVHECLGGKRGAHGVGTGSGVNGAHGHGVSALRQGGVKGSASMPVSRAGSISVGTSRAGTPAPLVGQTQVHQQHPNNQQPPPQTQAQAQAQAQSAFAVQAAAYAHQQAHAQAQAQAQAHQQAQQHQHQHQKGQQAVYGIPMAGMGGLTGMMPSMGLGGGALAGMGLGLGLGANAAPANLSLKTTAITPTTAPTVHAHAFVVPNANSANQQLNQQASASPMHSRNSSHGSIGGSSPGRSRPASAAGGFQQQQGHYVGQSQQQQRYGVQGQQQQGQQGYALPPNAMLTSPLKPSPSAEATATANKDASTGPSGSGSGSGTSTNSLFIDAHGEFVSAPGGAEDHDAMMMGMGMGFDGMGMDAGGVSPVKRAMQQGQGQGQGQGQDEMNAARAAALYARQQHAAAAAGMGMDM